MELKRVFTIRKILTPFIVIFASGFIGCCNWKGFINKLHDQAKEEKRDNVWFTKKAISLYFSTAFLTVVNLFAWSIFFILFLIKFGF
jgi:hypothetical protein